MSFEQARREALFLTDKMAYELNLTEEQYEACYEINLDYLMGVTGRTDVFGVYWERRNLDLSYILMDWQWNAFIAASYFYRPLYWEAGYWHFCIYARYPHRDYFYFGTPTFYVSYRGGHAWHIHGDRGYYYGHRQHFRAPRREHVGMHDRWDRGDFRGNRSSTRVTGRPEGRGRIENGGRVNRDRGVRSQESGASRILLGKMLPSKVISCLLTPVSCLLVIAMSFSFHAWLWIPVVIIIGTIAFVKALPAFILKLFVFFGTYSAAIFVAHPIARKLFITVAWQRDAYDGLMLYFVAAIGLSWAVKQLIDHLPHPRPQ
jgi:hypothetical protein